MASTREAVNQVSMFVHDDISLEAFEDWSASFLRESHNLGDDRTQVLARRLRSILNAFEDDDATDALKRELADAVRPFEHVLGIYIGIGVAETDAVQNSATAVATFRKLQASASEVRNSATTGSERLSYGLLLAIA
jgi:hypothetical protein